MSSNTSLAKDVAVSDGRRSWRLVPGHGSAGTDVGPRLASADGATNMAIDAALLESVAAGAPPTLRLYRWSPACLSFGRNQPTRGRYDVAAAAERGIDFVRRPTGGQAVLHDDELTYAVVAPVAVLGKPRAAYGLINRALVDGLGRLNVRAALAEGGGLPGRARGRGRVWDAACFRRPARGEVVVEGAKLVGSAQRLEGRTILQHGSILVGGSQDAAEELLVSGPGPGAAGPEGRAGAVALAPGWTTLEQRLARRPAVADVADAVLAGFREVLGVTFVGSPILDLEWEAVERERQRFESEEWTWRR